MLMARLLQQKYQGKRELIFVFCNTTKENPRTLDFVQECDQRWGLNIVWLEAVVHPDAGQGTTHRVVTYETAKRNGEVFEAVMQKFGLPNQVFKSCSRELKERPMASYMRERLAGAPYESAIGIRSDETFRINWVRAALERLVYPLATEWKATKLDVRKWWDRQPFDLQLKDYEGNCDLCWKKSKRKLATLISERPELADWWAEMERRYELLLKPNELAKLLPGQAIPPRRMYRGHESILDLVEFATGGDFRKVQDEYELYLQRHGRELYDEEMDAEMACTC